MTKKTWFITGCSRGFGRKLAAEILETSTDNVVVTARDIKSLDDFLIKYPMRVLAIKLDITKPEDIKTAVSLALDRFNKIDVLVNNAGYGLIGLIEECEMQDIREIFETNVFGLVALTKELLPSMRENRSGHIFNFSSIAGLVATVGSGIYCSTKFAVEGLSEALANEVKDFGIHVTIVEPGPFRTDFLSAKSVKWSPHNHAYNSNAQVMQARNRFEHLHKHNVQNGDPLQAVKLICAIAAMDNPPLRILMGNSAVNRAKEKLLNHLNEINIFEELSRSTDYDNV